MVFKVTSIPAANFDIKGIRKAVLNALDAEGNQLVKEYEQTTATWEGDKPEFTFIGSGISGGDAFIKVGPTGNKEGVKKWQILNAGSPAHTITATKEPTLLFQYQGFKAKTKPGKLKSGKGSPAGGAWASPVSVDHPGFPARGWSVTIGRQNKKRFPKRVNTALRKVDKFK